MYNGEYFAIPELQKKRFYKVGSLGLNSELRGVIDTAESKN